MSESTSEKSPKPGTPPDDAPSGRDQAQRQRRRDFLIQTGAVAGVALGAGWVTLAPPSWPLSLRDPDGERGKPRPPQFSLPQGGYAVAASATAAQIGIARGKDLVAMVRASIDAVGGIGRFISKGDIVVVKPNVAFERSAPLGATTHPDVVAAIVRLCREARAAEVRVADNPIEAPANCFARSGIHQAAVEAGARVFLPSPGDFELLRVPGAKWIERWPFFWRPFRDATKVIGVAPVKDHNLCSASMTTKNWYGLLGGRRNQFHQDIHGIISDLALMMRPTLVILDGSRVLFRSGPTGGSLEDVRSGNTIVAGTDMLAVDAFGWDDLLARKGRALPAYFAQAAQRKLGTPNWQELRRKEVRVG